MQNAAVKDTTKISASAQKSDDATAEITTEHSQETAHFSKEKKNPPHPNKKTHTQTTGHTKTSQNKLTS